MRFILKSILCSGITIALFLTNYGIMTVPLGLTNDMMALRQAAPTSERRFLWSFAGFKRAARLEMFKTFKRLQPHQCYFFDDRDGGPWLDRQQFRALLSDSIFSPCPMGNTVLESFRIYESLEMQCIPLLERRRWMPYYDCLMPGHSLPTFSSWSEAGEFVQALAGNQSEMVAYQQKIAAWWREYKRELTDGVTTFVKSGLAGAYRSSLTSAWRCRTGVPYQMWRMSELLKHANSAS